jgi:DNA-binding transcriptional ArsR family regulator
MKTEYRLCKGTHMTLSADSPDGAAIQRPEHVDAIFKVLSHRRRRTVLRCLDEDWRDVSELASRVATEEGTACGRSAPTASLLHVQTSLEHQHLPKLAHAGLVRWDRGEGRVTLGPAAEELSPLLEFASRYETVRLGGGR